MVDAQLAETVAVKACGACSGGLLERDRFCRWCGARQSSFLNEATDSIALVSSDRVSAHQVSSHQGSAARSSSDSLSPYTTSALARAGVEGRAYRRVSGPLVHALVRGMSNDQSGAPTNRVVRSIVQALVSIPIWLMIVLLSPIDAYVAAKSISREF